ncbi:MAG: DNA topoisomerase IV subunit B [Firmicutes bacterium]|nr:DNA topoisomerase IV subunit B [Bacillota bacterium]
MAKYDETSIKILEGLEAVRKRPGMYIGSTDKRGLHHLVWEIVDNSIDEVINGYGNHIKVILNKNGSVTISDNGRGVPIGMHESGKSTPEVIYTILHAGGKFEEGGYKVSGGLHGVGASVVNALSNYMDVVIYKEGKISNIRFEDGGKVAIPLKQVGETKKTGTTVTFFPNPEIFKNCKFSYTTICERMQESAFLISGLTIEVIDEEDGRSETFFYENGLNSFIDYINEGKSSLCNTLNFNSSKNGIEVSVALQYTDTYNENILSFVNNVKTPDGGSHEVGFKTGITKAFNDYAKNNNLVKGKDSLFEGSDVREGLSAVISLKIPENLLQFEGQTKSKLGTPEARSITESITYEQIKFFLEENKEAALTIIDKATKSMEARAAARKARELVRNGKGKEKKDKILSGKLAKATGKNISKNELFLVEGDSAGGSAKTGRDRETQAILPLRGKVLNCEKASNNDIHANEELNTLIYAIGAGIGNDFDPKDSNYGKVIIMTDADDDGAHIQTLLLTFFYRFMRPLIEAGMLYIANPPLYALDFGKYKEYIATDEELEERKREVKGTYKVQRFKGLGEMNSDELFETTMNPETRSLIKVSITDAALAEKRVSVLMGDKVEPRKEWIEENVDFTLEDSFRR